MPSGLSVSAWFIAAVRPETEPWPSMTVTVQPIALAASLTPSDAPRMPPFFRSAATNTIFLPLAAVGPVVGPSHLSARAVAAFAALVAMST